jgi:hypothetical protein
LISRGGVSRRFLELPAQLRQPQLPQMRDDKEGHSVFAIRHSWREDSLADLVSLSEGSVRKTPKRDVVHLGFVIPGAGILWRTW